MLTPLRTLLAAALLLVAVPLPAQHGAPAAPPPAPDSLSWDGYSAGARAAKQRGAAGWFWGGFVAGIPAGPGAVAVLSGEGGGLAQYLIASVGASAGVSAAARRSRVTLSPEQDALLAGSDSVYAESYRRAFTDGVRRKRAEGAIIGSVAGATVGAAALYALVCLAFCGEHT
ncbi:MAG TPA: hypothetical protein VF615_28805 [Longimicrobiaceae bacterium]|jgi:integral membrane sensor domain MASE1